MDKKERTVVRIRRGSSNGPAQAQNMNKIGVVSADGASTLDALEAKLAEIAVFFVTFAVDHCRVYPCIGFVLLVEQIVDRDIEGNEYSLPS